MKRKPLPLGLTILASTLVVLVCGCSGINTSQSVSPASFFLPGLMRVDPPPAPDGEVPAVVEPVVVAQAR
ncbi:MAG: hypothetical protein M5U12_25135 [Verrucomicrobia bacterium]|nr:hypothetical protein [Verrucomicrobiota bacterium]